MDGIFCKLVTCCNSVQKQGAISWAFGNFCLRVPLSVASFIIAYFWRLLSPSSTGYAGDYIISTVYYGIFLAAVVCVLFSLNKPLRAPPTSDLARSTGDAGDNIVARTSDGFDKSNVDAAGDSDESTGDAGDNIVARTSDGFDKSNVDAAGDSDESTGDAGDNIVARTSDGFNKSNVDAAVCSRVQTGSSRRTRLISAFFGFREWTDTFELDISELGKPIGPVLENVSWEHLGRPMKQRPKRTCALVACIMAVEAINRFVYELSHGKGTPFPWAAAKPRELLQECQLRDIWNEDTGAYVHDVLEVIWELGGVPVAKKKRSDVLEVIRKWGGMVLGKKMPSDARTVLPLTGWRGYTGAQLTQELVVELLRKEGPCIGTLWVCPWYHLFNANRNDAWVYRGCGRSQANRDESERLYGEDVSPHAVLCLRYRRCGDQIHVLVLDNHEANGPRRWVDAREIDGIYTLTVGKCLDPPKLESTR